MSGEAMLATQGLTKHFGGVTAVEDVDFGLGYGEVVGLVGDNGAGKSTLVKMLCGVLQPDEGKMFLEGKQISLDSPKDAKNKGIETVHQSGGLVNIFDVASNMFLGREPTKFGLLNKNKMRQDAKETLGRLGIDVGSSKSIVNNLSGGQQQAIAVGRAVFTDPRIVFMDEPTAALGVKEVDKVLNLITTLKEEGISVIFISHVLQEVFEVADRVVVLRRGKKVGDLITEETDKDEIVKLMVGSW